MPIWSPDPPLPKKSPRCEFKYQIRDEQVPGLMASLEPYCAVDPFVGPSGGRYTITSLYLDTPNRDLFWATELQKQNRMKLRVRTYGMQCEGPVFLEIKRRFGDAQVKSRVQVPRETWQWALEPGGLEKCRTWNLAPKKFAIVEDFAAQVAGWNLEPVACVRYDRDPLVGKLDPELRVTFDRAIRCFGTHDAQLHPHDRDYLPVDYAFNFEAVDPLLVLEIKFDMRFPIFLRDLVRRHDLRRDSFAKYCACVHRLSDDGMRRRTDTRRELWV